MAAKGSWNKAKPQPTQPPNVCGSFSGKKSVCHKSQPLVSKDKVEIQLIKNLIMELKLALSSPTVCSCPMGVRAPLKVGIFKGAQFEGLHLFPRSGYDPL